MNLQLFDSIFNYIRSDKNLIEMNIYHDDESYTIEYYIAGINKKDINLYHDNDTLTLEITNHEFPTLEVIRREFKGYVPTRSITLNDVDYENANLLIKCKIKAILGNKNTFYICKENLED